MPGSRFYLLLIMMCLVTACATRPPMPEGERRQEWQNHRDRLATLSQWKLEGRVAIRVEQEGWSAGLHWRQNQAAYSIRLIAPMGNGIYDLRGNPGSAQLRLPDGRLLYARDAQGLLQKNLGWDMPVQGLAYWVRGLPAPGNEPASLSLDDQGRLQELQQDGWRVRYERYGLYSGGFSLPEKLSIEREGMRLRLSIHSWEM